MTDADRLLARVKAGNKLTASELAEVRSALRRSDGAEDPYALIHILWESKDAECRADLVHALQHNVGDIADDGMVRRIAVQALADLWPDEKTFDLVDRLRSTDTSRLVRMAAASALGDVGSRCVPMRGSAARALMMGFRASRDPFEREAHYEGLLNLLAIPQRKRPPATQPLDDCQIDHGILEAAAKLANDKS